MRYEISHVGFLPLDYIWGTHPALWVDEHTVFRIPARTGIVGVAASREFGEAGQHYAWPHLGATDMSRVLPPSAGVYAGHYLTDLQAGWFAVEDGRTGAGVLFGFPRRVCPTLWLWMCYGGWRGYGNVVVVEPWTSRPVRLDQAVTAGAARRLEPGTGFRVEICVTPYHGPDEFDGALRRVAG
jgi:hypothetical protein